MTQEALSARADRPAALLAARRAHSPPSRSLWPALPRNPERRTCVLACNPEPLTTPGHGRVPDGRGDLHPSKRESGQRAIKAIRELRRCPHHHNMHQLTGTRPHRRSDPPVDVASAAMDAEAMGLTRTTALSCSPSPARSASSTFRTSGCPGNRGGGSVRRTGNGPGEQDLAELMILDRIRGRAAMKAADFPAHQRMSRAICCSRFDLLLLLLGRPSTGPPD